MIKTKKVMCSAKMEPELIEELDKVAKAHKMSRSNLMREFAKNAEAYYDFLISQRAKQQAEMIAINGILSRWVLENSPPEVDSKMMRFLGAILRYAAEMKEAQEKMKNEK
jgi:metal-responsive CopG/Arc/MetJ family transcriptional regulator